MRRFLWMRCAVSIAIALAICAGCADSEGDPPTPMAEAVELGAASDSFEGLEATDLLGEFTSDSDDQTDQAAQDRPREEYFPGISFVIPKSWEKQELSAALKEVVNSKYTIPHAKGDMELTMTTMGGGAEENIQRWVGQMQLGPGETPKNEVIDINGVATRWVDVRGTYTSRVSQKQGPFADYRLIGVVIPNQPKDFMLKLIGPREAVADFHDEFKRVVKTAHFDR